MQKITKQAARVNGDHALLVGRDHPGRNSACYTRDARAARSVRSGIEAYAEPLRAAADTLPDLWCVLTDTGG